MKFTKYVLLPVSLLVMILLLGFDIGLARAKYDIEGIAPGIRKITASGPYVDIGVHKVGKIGLTISNTGSFGTGFLSSLPGEAPSCVYPYPGQQDYLFAASFWIGAVVGRDTLVSVGADGWFRVREMWPDPYPRGEIIARSISSDEDAISEQDYIAVYTDTVTDPGLVDSDPRDGRPHMPLNIEATQRSYAWSYSYAEDFILFDYSIKNIGRKTLENTYMAFYVDADVEMTGSQEGFKDDICGFKRSVPSAYGCGFIDTINIAWISDNNGRDSPDAQYCQLPSLTGTRVVRTPSDSLQYSFNWWISNGDASKDWGPRRVGTPDDPFRDFGGFLGTPEGDKNKYYVMRHEEFDYDQLFCAMDHTSEGWMPRDPQCIDFADGYDTRYLLSFGPFDIDPGEVLPISFAYIAGEDFHTEPCDAMDKLFDAYHPEAYHDYLDFDDFGQNALWASWIYDNPGYDTDGDGYSGKYRICGFDSVLTYDTVQLDPIIVDTHYVYTVADTVYYEGDNVPDFRGASPPPAPEIWVVDTSGDTLRSRIYPRINDFNQGELVIRWNGFLSETEKDVFSNKVDFEGYRVYLSYTPSGSDFTMVASYDIEDYNRYTWSRGRGLWELKDTPFTIDSLKTLYGEAFDPLNHDRDHPLYWNDTAYYFASQDWNQSGYRDTNSIHKVYPDESPPTIPNIDSARVYYPEELTENGLFFKHYEYKYILRNLLPSQLHYVAVTTYDYGSPASGLGSLEIPPYKNYVAEYPRNPADMAEEKELNVIVYPNPYRIDGKYRDIGFEGRDYVYYIDDPSGEDRKYIVQGGLPDDRTRSIHFINLPHRCTIRIFTIDGDLVREIKHEVPADYPQSSHERWDLITRNTQAIVSGIYYYSVESDYGNQVGKIVIIM